MADLKRGDSVTWNTPQGETSGKVIKKATGTTHIQGHKVAASSNNPEYIVRSDTSGKAAAHKPGSLQKD